MTDRTFSGLATLVGALTIGALFTVAATASAATTPQCEATATGLVPISDMTDSTYLGNAGGLYPNGNSVPVDHLELGLRVASEIRPLSRSGTPDPRGIVAVVSIGVSNTRAEFAQFMQAASADPEIDRRVTFVNGAQGGTPLEEWATGPDSAPWHNIDSELHDAGVSAEQVQVAWVKLPDESRGTSSLADVRDEHAMVTKVLATAKARYPNLQIAYLSSRIYGGYSRAPDAEPNAYHHGFAVKWLIERQIKGDPKLNADASAGEVVSPWLAWGPYLWADGQSERRDGLSWECKDFREDGIHPSRDGARKVADLLMSHFKSHATSVPWFLASGDGSNQPNDAEPSDPPLLGESVSPTTREQRSEPQSPRLEIDPATESVPTTVEQAVPDPQGTPAPVIILVTAAVGFPLGLAAVVRTRPRRAGRDRSPDARTR
jgi:hypothetical protein